MESCQDSAGECRLSAWLSQGQSALEIAGWPPGIQPDPELDCPEKGKWLLRIAAARGLPALSQTGWACLKLVFVSMNCVSGFSKDPSSSGFPTSI